jgi:hypothetical protein
MTAQAATATPLGDATGLDETPMVTGSGGQLLSRILIAILLATYAVIGCSLIMTTHHGVGTAGMPPFYDFNAFYQAATFARDGHAAAAYDDARMIAAEHAAFPGTTAKLPWYYPPSFQFALMPLTALPYFGAWLVWTVAGLGVYGLTVRRLFPRRHFWLMALAPAAALNVVMSQNGLLNAALMATGVLLLPRRPIVAGVTLGLLAFKPHLALLAPLALLFGREWRALAAAVVSQAALILLSAVVLGPAPWIAFIHKATAPAATTSTNWLTIPSTMVFARSLGLSPGASSALHWTVAAAAAAAALWVWSRRRDVLLRAGALATATLLITPYLRPYDLALLALPIAALLPRDGEPRTVTSYAAAAAAWATPPLVAFVHLPVQFGALVIATVMGLVVWRSVRTQSEDAAPLPAGGGPALRVDRLSQPLDQRVRGE